MANTYVGIDVFQHQIDLAVRGAEDVDGLPHDQESLETLSDRLTALAPDRIVMEATGGLEVLLAASLQDVGLPVVVVRLCQAHAFGRASVGRATRPPAAPMPDPAGGTARTCSDNMKFRCTTNTTVVLDAV